MKVFILSLFGLAAPLLLYGQIGGKIMAEGSLTPIKDAFIQAFDKDSVVIETAFSDEYGTFILNAHQVDFIRISQFSYDVATVKVNRIDSREDITIFLKEKDLTLQEVTVTGQLHTKNATTETIVITDSLRKGVNSAAMLLNKIKGVRADMISENIKIGPEDNVPIIVNGKETATGYAISINPKRIKKIEIIRHPEGRFSGIPVIINLVLTEGYVGWDIAPHIMAMSSLRNKYSNQEKISLDATWSFGKWNLYGTLNVDRKDFYNASAFEKYNGNAYREYSMPIDIKRPNIQDDRNHKVLNIGADYTFSQKHTISLQTQADLNANKNLETYDLIAEELSKTQQFHQQNDNQYSAKNYAIRSSYQGRFSEKLHIKSVFLYNYYTIKENKSYLLGEQIFSNTNYAGEKNYITFDVNATCRPSSIWKFSCGNTFTWYEYQNKNTNRTEYQSRNVRNRVDANIRFSPHKKLEIVGGIVHQTIQNKNLQDNQSFSKFIPYAKIFWQPFQFLDVSFNYFDDVEYPTLDQLSPIRWQIDRFLVHTGNPNLKARIMHYAELQVDFKKLFKITCMHKKANNDINTFYEQDKNTYFLETLTNCNYKHTYVGIEGDYNIIQNLNFTILLNYQWHTKYKDKNDKRNGHTYSIEAQLAYTFPTTKINLMSNYFLRYDKLPMLQGEKYQQQESFVCGINKMFFQNKLSATFMLSLPTSLISKNTFEKIAFADFQRTIKGDDRVNSLAALMNLRLLLGNKKSHRKAADIQIEQEKE